MNRYWYPKVPALFPDRVHARIVDGNQFAALDALKLLSKQLSFWALVFPQAMCTQSVNLPVSKRKQKK
jgi:hypothetical protein